MVGTGIAASFGVLIKGGDVLERINSITTVVFDKTGTLTTGHCTVEKVLAFGEVDEMGEYSIVCVLVYEFGFFLSSLSIVFFVLCIRFSFLA